MDHTATFEEPLKLVVAGQGVDAMDEARDRAETRLTDELNEGGRFRHIINNIWKGNVAREFYRQRYIHEAKRAIDESGDIHLYQGPEQARIEAKMATLERFQSEDDELIHTEAGERREVRTANDELSTHFKDILRRYFDDSDDSISNEDALIEERTRFLQEYRQYSDNEAFGKGTVVIDNLTDIARAIAGKLEHGASLDHVLENMQVISGETREGVRTEAKHNKVDKIIEKLSSSPASLLVNETVLITGVTVAATIARLGSRSIVGAVTKTIAPGIAAGAWAGLRENKIVKDERAQHAREIARGEDIDVTTKRRAEMEATRYETVSAPDLERTLRVVGDNEALKAGGKDALQVALDSLAAVEARIRLSDQRHIDLISYTDSVTVGRERTDLDVARSEVRRTLDGHLTDELRDELGIDRAISLKDHIRQQADTFVDGIEQDMSAKDKAFKSLRMRRVASAAAIGSITGIVGGLVAQETLAAFDPTRAGLLEQIWGAKNVTINGEQHQTILEGLAHGDHQVIHTGPSHQFDTHAFGSTGEMSITDDHAIIDNKDGTISLLDPNKHVTLANVPIDANGNLPASSLKELHAAGMNVVDTSFDKQVTVTTNQQVSVDQYVQNHIAEATKVKRDIWYANDTQHVYDKNELGLHWGGNGGLAPNGYEMNVSNMTTGGSYEGSQSANWQQVAAEGNMKLAVSASLGTQSEVFMVDVAPDGSVNIPAGSPASQFFQNVNGHAVFTGAYAEAVQTTGADADGVTHMRPLATLVGNRSQTSVMDQVTTTTTEHHAQYTITTNGYDTTINNFTEVAPVIPLTARRPLERNRTENTEGMYGYNAEGWESQRRRWSDTRMPELQQNPNAHIQTGEALNFYENQQRDNRGQAYVDEIDRRIDSSAELQAINDTTRAMIVMPVAAVAESENIYRALSFYDLQDEEAKKQTVITLNLNWTQAAENDPDLRAKVDQTLAEVERARQDFPDLQIASFTTIFDDRPVYGEVIKSLYDTAAFAVQRAERTGAIDPDQDILLITNDADPLGMHRHYLKNYIEAVEEHKDSDAFIGTIRWDTESARDYPGYHVSQLFMQAMNIATTRTTQHSIAPTTIGPNSAFRVSMYAAVGGCDAEMGVGADSDLGRRVLAARGYVPTPRGTGYQSSTKIEGDGYGYDHPIIRQVIGADIDSDGSRLLNGGYRNGRWLAAAWDNFDAGETRAGAGVKAELIEPENVVTEFPVVQHRIEDQISKFITEWYPDQGVASFTLSMLFPDAVSASGITNAWQLRRTSKGYRFSFTQTGAERLRNSLMRDAQGRFDPVANRLKRRLYGSMNAATAKRPMSVEAPLVRPSENAV